MSMSDILTALLFLLVPLRHSKAAAANNTTNNNNNNNNNEKVSTLKFSDLSRTQSLPVRWRFRKIPIA